LPTVFTISVDIERKVFAEMDSESDV
jgi:hypothetical protein